MPGPAVPLPTPFRGLPIADPPPRIGCSHPFAKTITTLNDPTDTYWCPRSECGAEWSSTHRIG